MILHGIVLVKVKLTSEYSLHVNIPNVSTTEINVQ